MKRITPKKTLAKQCVPLPCQPSTTNYMGMMVLPVDRPPKILDPDQYMIQQMQPKSWSLLKLCQEASPHNIKGATLFQIMSNIIFP